MTYLSISNLKVSTVKELGGNILFFIADNAKLLGFTNFFKNYSIAMQFVNINRMP